MSGVPDRVVNTEATIGLARGARRIANPSPRHVLGSGVVIKLNDEVIGSIGAAKPAGQQALFAAGAMTASLIWFVILALGCQRLTGLFRSAVVWRCLDVGVAVLMVYLAGMLMSDSLSIFEVILEG